MVNKAIAQNNIKDAEEKAAILRSMSEDLGTSTDSLFLISKSLLISNDLISLTNEYQDKSIKVLSNIGTLLQSCVKLVAEQVKQNANGKKNKAADDAVKSANNVASSLKGLLNGINSIKDLTANNKALISKNSDIKALSMTQSMSARLRDPREDRQRDAQAKKTNPDLLNALDGITAAVKAGAKATVKTVNTTSKANIVNQTNNSKKILASNKKAENAKRRDILTGNDANTKKAAKDKKDKPKVKKEKDTGKFDMKMFMTGFTGLLKTLFNPVAIVMSLIAEFLPYIILAIAFLQGFWEGIGGELREKITTFFYDYGLPVLAIAAAAFILIKGKSLLLIAAKVAWFIAKKVAWLAWFVFKKAAWLALHLLKIVFEGIKLAASVAAAWAVPILIGALIGAAVLLLIGGLILGWKKLGDKIMTVFNKVIDIFKTIVNTVVGFVKGFIEKISEPLSRLINGISNTIGRVVKAIFGSIGNLFGGSDSSASSSSNSESSNSSSGSTTSKPPKLAENAVTKDLFTQKLELIIAPLHTSMLCIRLLNLQMAELARLTAISARTAVITAWASVASASTQMAEATKEKNKTENNDKLIAAINKPNPKLAEIEAKIDDQNKLMKQVIELLASIDGNTKAKTNIFKNPSLISPTV